jgi:hypothetical protein
MDSVDSRLCKELPNRDDVGLGQSQSDRQFTHFEACLVREQHAPMSKSKRAVHLAS